MTIDRDPMAPECFLDHVADALAKRRTPLDPVSPGEYAAAVRAFPGEAWRWAPQERERVELLGGLPDPHDEQDRAKAIATLLEHADEFGPIVQALAAGLGDSDA
jgi:hypothetical protein